jgi:hypothetical protein
MKIAEGTEFTIRGLPGVYKMPTEADLDRIYITIDIVDRIDNHPTNYFGAKIVIKPWVFVDTTAEGVSFDKIKESVKVSESGVWRNHGHNVGTYFQISPAIEVIDHGYFNRIIRGYELNIPTAKIQEVTKYVVGHKEFNTRYDANVFAFGESLTRSDFSQQQLEWMLENAADLAEKIKTFSLLPR